MESTIMFATPWLASACPAAASVVTQSKLRRAKAARAQALIVSEPGAAVFGVLADVASYGIPAYRPILTDRPMGDEQTNHTANGGVRGPHYAWREPVTT
ncbi:hypothetical protein [Planotetraspora sp. GP83]|uniref:hypothetical protein n=1 Tax=Planotetraspora sp. GP83 TaxID=3156264 RepID=UPI003517B79C